MLEPLTQGRDDTWAILVTPVGVAIGAFAVATLPLFWGTADTVRRSTAPELPTRSSSSCRSRSRSETSARMPARHPASAGACGRRPRSSCASCASTRTR